MLKRPQRDENFNYQRYYTQSFGGNVARYRHREMERASNNARRDAERAKSHDSARPGLPGAHRSHHHASVRGEPAYSRETRPPRLIEKRYVPLKHHNIPTRKEYYNAPSKTRYQNMQRNRQMYAEHLLYEQSYNDVPYKTYDEHFYGPYHDGPYNMGPPNKCAYYDEYLEYLQQHQIYHRVPYNMSQNKRAYEQQIIYRDRDMQYNTGPQNKQANDGHLYYQLLKYTQYMQKIVPTDIYNRNVQTKSNNKRRRAKKREKAKKAPIMMMMDIDHWL